MLRQSIIDKLEAADRVKTRPLSDDHLILIGWGTKRDLERQLMEQSETSRNELRELARSETFWGVPLRILKDVETTVMVVKVVGREG